MKKLAVIFGSRSAEHDVSIISGMQLIENVDKSKFDPYPVYISRTGEWFVGQPLNSMKFYRAFDPSAKGLTKVYLPPVPGMNGLYAQRTGGFFQKADEKIAHIDCAILALHGMHGEDGSIQGLFEMADIPYSSVGVTGSGVGMDKIIMKAVFESMGLNVLPSKYCYRSYWQQEPERVLDDMEQLGFPLFVKPANLGSSIGIGKAEDRESLRNRIEVATRYDRRILVEKAVVNREEINCAALGYGENCLPSACEQPVTTADMELLGFDEKYLSNAKGQGMEQLSRIIPAPIGEERTKYIQDTTCEIFRMLECKGVVRIDYIVDKDDDTIYVNEINTIPGSFAFYLFEPVGIPYSQLINKLVEYAFAAQAEKQASMFSYDSAILEKVISGVGAKGAKTKSGMPAHK
ncbi:D-alanine--D-alanine ligase [Eubacteriales bacterium OttesenSCG-928-K08]|nr:D-alanine--D-alanine ligase [Eubacteriales bacterium OttesenSCG-928-K08]